MKNVWIKTVAPQRHTHYDTGGVGRQQAAPSGAAAKPRRADASGVSVSAGDVVRRIVERGPQQIYFIGRYMICGFTLVVRRG